MFRPHAVTSIAAIFCLVGGCQTLTGSVEVVPPSDGPAPGVGPVTSGVNPVQGSDDRDLPPPGSLPGANAGSEGPVDVPFVPGQPPLNGAAGESDAGTDAGGIPERDPEPPPPAPRPVLVASAASELERVGEEGGDPHLGVCAGGVVIGVRPTANPRDEVFGQRVTLVEPLCGTLMLVPSAPGDPAGARVRVTPDDELLRWEQSDVFQGPPPTEVPDDRLEWVVQPPTVCPEAAPVLVGLAGEYDPSVSDQTGTAAIRSVLIECAPLEVAPDGIQVRASVLGRQRIERSDTFAAEGDADYASSCGDGSVITQILVHAGFWLDGFVLGCSSLASPHLEGEPCGAGSECQSTVCGSEATCEP